MADPNLLKCVNEALSENIECGKDPESCAFMLDTACEKIPLESVCTPDILRKVATISASETGDASSVDAKLTVNQEDCL